MLIGQDQGRVVAIERASDQGPVTRCEDTEHTDLRCGIMIACDDHDGGLRTLRDPAQDIAQPGHRALWRAGPVENVARDDQQIRLMVGDCRLDLRQDRRMILLER